MYEILQTLFTIGKCCPNTQYNKLIKLLYDIINIQTLKERTNLKDRTKRITISSNTNETIIAS